MAFGFPDESSVYDALDRSAGGNLLARIYLETRKSLGLQNRGGARAENKKVELLDLTQENIKGDVDINLLQEERIR